jgi:hypothetical protein
MLLRRQRPVTVFPRAAALLTLRRGVAIMLVGVALACALAQAVEKAWTCDDAYVVFRYAQNLIDGHGLVFNAGERVEGYTCFLWTMWCALGMALRVGPERWTNGSGIACYLGLILVLARLHFWWRARSAAGLIPFAALAVALHPEMNAFATGGLETSAFTFLLMAGSAVLICGALTDRRLVIAGLVFGLAVLTRPDGALPAVVAGAWVLWRGRRRAVLPFGGALTALVLPHLIWRVVYYGDLFPNTYYAKSGNLAYWSQGWQYLRLYLQLYWPVMLAVPLGMLAAIDLWRRLRSWRLVLETDWVAAMVLLMAMGLTYTLYVVRLGGDFMYARMLLPPTPLLLAAAEGALLWLAGAAAHHFPRFVPGHLARRTSALVAALAAVALALIPRQSGRPIPRAGIEDEAAFYSSAHQMRWSEHVAEVLGAATSGFPLRMAMFGTDVKIAYRTRASYALDGHGLTDHFIAHQPLTTRGRPGHEKWATTAYMLSRGIHFVLRPMRYFGFDPAEDLIPHWRVELAPDIKPYLIQWDPALMALLRSRGARFNDFPAYLDGYLANVDRLPPATIKADLARFTRFYFPWVSDPRREEAFERAAARAD